MVCSRCGYKPRKCDEPEWPGPLCNVGGVCRDGGRFELCFRCWEKIGRVFGEHLKDMQSKLDARAWYDDLDAIQRAERSTVEEF